nr:DUF4153 domain-containing protein [uncultured Enterobacter sp.]
MTHDRALPRVVVWLMLLIGGLQGALFYLVDKYETLAHLPDDNPLRLYALPVSMVVSATLIFCLRDIRQRVLWQSLAAMLVVVCVMSAWVSWNMRGVEQFHVDDFPLFYDLSLAAMLLLSIPWLQVRLNSAKGWNDYAMLIDCHWQNGLILLLSLLSGGLFWLVLFLWAELFKLLDITFFSDLFFDRAWFALIACGAVFALTVALGRSQPRILRAVQSLFTMIARVLLPLLSLLMLLFLITLPFVGLSAISRHVSSGGLLNGLSILLLLLTVLVWDPLRGKLPYPAIIRHLVCLSLIAAPLCVIAAGWALWLRVNQYGWTPQRVYAALITAIALVWALGYVWLLFNRRIAALTLHARVNGAVLLLALLALVLVHTPVIDPYRISVDSHMNRYRNGVIRAEHVSLYMLKSAGRRGAAALRELEKDPYFIDSPERLRSLRMLSDSPHEEQDPLDMARVRQSIALASPSIQPDDAFWKMLLKEQRYVLAGCGVDNKHCMLQAQDLNQDGKPEWLLWQFADKSVSVYGQQNGQWQPIGANRSLPTGIDAASLKAAVAQGHIGTVAKQWQDMTLNGQRVKVEYWRTE